MEIDNNKHHDDEKFAFKIEKSKKLVFLGVFQIVCACIFSLILYLFFELFGGEFVVIAENLWILLVFATILVGSAIYSTVIIILSRKSGRIIGVQLKSVNTKTGWILGWSIWNMFLGVVLIVVFVVLYILVADVLTGTLFLLVFVLALPFIGYGVLFIYSSLRIFINKIKRKVNLKIIDGLTEASISIIFLISSFGLTIAFYNPQWSVGVQRQRLFVLGEQEGRGYRIPAMLALPGDVVLAFSESRVDAMLDWGDIDLVMKRSTDGGKTWGSIQVLRNEEIHTAGNPCPVYDRHTNTVWLPYCVDNKKVFVMSSADLGLTWSEPREITEELDLGLSGSTSQLDMEYGTGPGCGIQLDSGRLAIPSYYFDGRGSHIVYSDDHGMTWKKGENLNYGGECQAFEAVNGSLCINCRTRDGYRYVAWSNDEGETWEPGYLDKEFTDPGCMASIYRFTKTPKSRVLFSNPDRLSRGHLTIRMSYDEGNSWPVSKLVYEGPSAYSQIVVLENNSLCVLFETGRYDYRESITFVTVDLTWLTNGQDQL